MQKRHYFFPFIFICLALVTSRGFTHDFWLEAHPFYTTPQKSVDISVHVGNQFIGDSLPNIADWYSDFSLYQNSSKSDLPGELGRDPAGYFKPSETGTYVIGYQSHFIYVEIAPETFKKYLAAEGLETVIQYRQQNKLEDSVGKENYIRHAKTLVQSGNGFSIDNSSTVLGYELEIIPLSNPYRKKIGDSLKVKVLYQNKPIENILLIALSKEKPEQTQAVRSNAKGEVSIVLNQKGPWLLKAVKILKIEDDKANWQSHWASLTFDVDPY